MTLLEQAKAAKQASYAMMILPTPEKDAALYAMAEALEQNAEEILAHNAQDIEHAREKGITDAMLDRLRLTHARITGMANGLRKVAALPDPVGSEDYVQQRPNGLMIGKRRVPLGVVGIIYEARPNVTADAIGLCIKSGNAVVLRGGSEAISSNIAIVRTMCRAGYAAGLPEGAIQLLVDTSRETATQMMRLNGLIDVLIDGPYIHERNFPDCVLRGSDNQCIHYLNPEARAAYAGYLKQGRVLESFSHNGSVIITGIANRRDIL